jgi:hypothetical protein
MSVLSYIAPAAVVLALSWAIVKLTRMPAGTPAIAAVTSVAVFGLIAITPLCGFMFGCGCDWPWSGLYDHCNFFDALSKLKCPWCNNVAAGALSMLAVFGASILVAYRASSITASANTRFTSGVLAGAVTFHLVSLATGALSALATGYPLPFTA